MFRNLTIEQFEQEFAHFQFVRAIRFVDTHHTYRPARAHYRGLSTIVAMERFHKSLDWTEIGQHLSIGPAGEIWTGRNWNRIPCSHTGFNTGAFMYEFIANFCDPSEAGTLPPYDKLGEPDQDAQCAAGVAVSAAVLARFQLPLSSVRFHRQLHAPGARPPKTCPGNSVNWTWFADLVEQRCVSRWNYDPAGGKNYGDLEAEVAEIAAATFDPFDREGSATDLQVAADFDIGQFEAGGSAFA